MPSPSGDLVLGDFLAVYRLDPADVLVVRHTEGPGLSRDWSEAEIIASTRSQLLKRQIWYEAPSLWLLFWADGGLRSRYYGAYRNYGEMISERTDTNLFFHLESDGTMAQLRDRLVVEWSRDAVNWAKRAADATQFRVVEVADAREFPGFDSVLLSHGQLRQIVDSQTFRSWRTALSSVQGIYLITDVSTGQLYVGQANGRDGILGRWCQYAVNGHGGNRELKSLVDADPGCVENFRYSILRVFGLGASPAEINTAEEHYKRVLMTRTHGLNAN